MKIIFITLSLLILSTLSKAEELKDKNLLGEKLLTECRNNKELIDSFQKYGAQKHSLIIDAYCSCRTEFLLTSLNKRQISKILYKRESLSEDLFVKLIIECTQHINSLTKD